MTPNLSDQHELLLDEVAIKGRSPVFHFLVETDNPFIDGGKSVCGNLRTEGSGGDVTYKHVEDAMGDSKRPCQLCTKWLRRSHNTQSYLCAICGRLNLITDVEFKVLKIPFKIKDQPYNSDDEDEVAVCTACKRLVEEA